MLFFFFFQAEDGIRDGTVTGVQTCALPILCAGGERLLLPGRPTAALSSSAPDRAWGHLQRHCGAVPRVSPETRLHAGRLSETLRALGGAGARAGPRPRRHAGL